MLCFFSNFLDHLQKEVASKRFQLLSWLLFTHLHTPFFTVPPLHCCFAWGVSSICWRFSKNAGFVGLQLHVYAQTTARTFCPNLKVSGSNPLVLLFWAKGPQLQEESDLDRV